MSKIYTLPYKIDGLYKFVDVYLDCFKVTFIIDLNVESSFVNRKYFLTYKDADLYLHHVRCNFIRHTDVHLPLKSCLDYKSNQIHIYGVLGQNFFRNYQLLFDNPENQIMFFNHNEVFVYKHNV